MILRKIATSRPRLQKTGIVDLDRNVGSPHKQPCRNERMQVAKYLLYDIGVFRPAKLHSDVLSNGSTSVFLPCLLRG